MKDYRTEAGKWNRLVPRDLGQLAARVLMPLVLAFAVWGQWRRTDKSVLDLWPAAGLAGFALFALWSIYFRRKSTAADTASESPGLV
jgi:hypothetical protein